MAVDDAVPRFPPRARTALPSRRRQRDFGGGSGVNDLGALPRRRTPPRVGRAAARLGVAWRERRRRAATPRRGVGGVGPAAATATFARERASSRSCRPSFGEVDAIDDAPSRRAATATETRRPLESLLNAWTAMAVLRCGVSASWRVSTTAILRGRRPTCCSKAPSAARRAPRRLAAADDASAVTARATHARPARTPGRGPSATSAGRRARRCRRGARSVDDHARHRARISRPGRVTPRSCSGT